MLNSWQKARSQDGPSENWLVTRLFAHYLSFMLLGSDFKILYLMLLANLSSSRASWSLGFTYSRSLNVLPVCPFLFSLYCLDPESYSILYPLTRIAIKTCAHVRVHPPIHSSICLPPSYPFAHQPIHPPIHHPLELHLRHAPFIFRLSPEKRS